MTRATIKMQKGKDCKGSVRFETADVRAAVSNVYVSRALARVNDAKEITVVIEVPDQATTPATQ